MAGRLDAILGAFVAQPEGFAPFAPDLALEVLSPGDTFAEVLARVQDYLAAGTRAVWVLDPRSRTVSVYRAGGALEVVSQSQELDTGDIMPGLRISLAGSLPEHFGPNLHWTVNRPG